MKLSEEAQSWLSYFTDNPHVRISYTSLMKLGVSRRRGRAVIRELEKADKIARKRAVGAGTILVLTEGTTVVPWKTLYSHIDHSASTAIVPIAVQLEMNNIATNKFLDGVQGEGTNVGYDFFEMAPSEDSDLARAREKHDAKKKAEYLARREAKDEQRKSSHRSKVDYSLWTCKDVAYEFATRLGEYWEIAPFSVTQTRFVQALATFRRQHNTNGALEHALVELFFENFRSEKITDGNHAWRTFLYKAPQLLPTARERVITPEQIETAIIDDTARAERKLSLFDEDDDV